MNNITIGNSAYNLSFPAPVNTQYLPKASDSFGAYDVKASQGCTFISQCAAGPSRSVILFFNKKCIVCRETTERVEGMGTFAFMSSPDKVESDFYAMINDHIPDDQCPYGDGRSAERITDILLEQL